MSLPYPTTGAAALSGGVSEDLSELVQAHFTLSASARVAIPDRPYRASDHR